MKLKIGQKWYLQHYDVMFILNHAERAPEVVLDEIFKENSFVKGEDDLKDYFKFDIIFSNPDAIRWLDNQAYIVDFEKMRCTKLQALEINRDQLRVEYGQMYSGIDFTEHTEEQKYKIAKLVQKIKSLDAGIDFRMHRLEFDIPMK